MASLSYFIIGPSAILSILGLIRGPDQTTPTPAEDYRQATIDIVVPAFNEERNIVLCLKSISEQTVQPNNIYLVDDGSSDRTSQFASEYASSIGLNLKVFRREKSVGKTPTLHKAASESEADVLFVLDGDTILRSPNYIEKLVQELYQGVGIACACGVILPEYDQDRLKMMSSPTISEFSSKHPEVISRLNKTWLQRTQQNFTNNYREELYLFLQKFIYHGEMVFFGTLINPIGCAVAYRRKYILDVLTRYHKMFGYDLTTSEDIFIGFAFADIGYRNIQVKNVYALTVEPPISKIPKQILMWSSAFLQSCYYFDPLVRTPLKFPRALFNNLRMRLSGQTKKITEMRKIKEAYRQSFNPDVTKKYGRPIGWFIFTTLFEKIAYSTTLIILILLGKWEVLFLTIGAETAIYTIVVTLMHQNRRLSNFIKSILYTPIRYAVLIFDYFVILNFAKDLWLTSNRRWRK